MRFQRGRRHDSWDLNYARIKPRLGGVQRRIT